MKRIAKFHKVSFEQFKKDWVDTFGPQDEQKIQEIYDSVKLPRRATAGSAGYDFFAPVRFALAPGETVKVPTGVPRGDGHRVGAQMLPQERTGL